MIYIIYYTEVMINKEVVRVKDGTRFVEIQARRSTYMVLLGMLMSMHKWVLLWPI